MQSIIQNLLRLYEGFFHRYPKANLDVKTEPFKKIVIFLYSSHGDIALSSSFTQYIRSIYPKGRIIFITSKKCKYVTSLNPDIDHIITVNFPRFWTYRNVENLKKNLDYDMFLNASFYPNLRYLIPFMPLIDVPFFLYRDRPKKIPTPRLHLDFKPVKKNYVVLNLEAGTLGWHKNMVTTEDIENIKRKIVTQFPRVKFIINESYGQKNTITGDNVKVFSGSFRDLLKISSSSLGIVSIRSGLNDVIAATMDIPQFVIYPEGNFPDDDGIPTHQWGNMINLGYSAQILESLINKNSRNSIKKCIQDIFEFVKILTR